MSLCACCNRVIHPDFARDNSYCQVCSHADCNSLHAAHDEQNLKEHHDD